MWDLPGPGLEPVSPALAGGFLTTAPPGKSWDVTSEIRFKKTRACPLALLLTCSDANQLPRCVPYGETHIAGN